MAGANRALFRYDRLACPDAAANGDRSARLPVAFERARAIAVLPCPLLLLLRAYKGR